MKISRLRSSSENLALNDSLYPFCHGAPGSMKSVCTPRCLRKLRTCWAMNSEPLSERMQRGAPRCSMRLFKVTTTSAALMDVSTLIARHSLVNSSTMASILRGAPFSVRSWTKSYAQTWLVCSAFFLSQGCRRGVFFVVSLGP